MAVGVAITNAESVTVELKLSSFATKMILSLYHHRRKMENSPRTAMSSKFDTK